MCSFAVEGLNTRLPIGATVTATVFGVARPTAAVAWTTAAVAPSPTTPATAHLTTILRRFIRFLPFEQAVYLQDPYAAQAESDFRSHPAGLNTLRADG
jgi:hypothetical protein